MKLKEALKFMYFGIDLSKTDKNSYAQKTSILTTQNNEKKKVFSVRKKVDQVVDNDRVSDKVIITIARSVTLIFLALFIFLFYVVVSKAEVSCFVETVITTLSGSAFCTFIGILATLLRVSTDALKSRS